MNRWGLLLVLRRRLSGAAFPAALWAVLLLPQQGSAQGPTLETSGTIQAGVGGATPGTSESLLGSDAGRERRAIGNSTGERLDDFRAARARGAASPDIDLELQAACTRDRLKATQRPPPQPIPTPKPPFYGTLELPSEEEALTGPPDGLTLEQAIERLMTANLDLLAKQFEIPQARADVLTASLIGNPIFFADAQLVPYGTDSVKKPDGPTQYDVNMQSTDRLCRTSGGRGCRSRPGRSRSRRPSSRTPSASRFRTFTSFTSMCWQRGRQSRMPR